jgi:hypothetical protein
MTLPITSSEKKRRTGILVTPTITTEMVESAEKNFVNSSDQHPTFTNIVSVCRTQKSGDKDILQRNLMTCGPTLRGPIPNKVCN